MFTLTIFPSLLSQTVRRISFTNWSMQFYDSTLYVCSQDRQLRRGSVVVKAGIDPRSCHLGFFSEASDKSMCPGVDSASKNEYQDIPGGKGGLSYHLHMPSVKKSGSLNLLDHSRPRRHVTGIPYLNY